MVFSREFDYSKLDSFKDIKFCIYKFTNNQNGKIYVGQTQTSIKQRIMSHVLDAKSKDFYFYRAIRKYGWSKFSVEILEIIPNEDKTLLLEREKFWIKELKSNDPLFGYNSSEGGEKPSQKSIDALVKFSKNRKGKSLPKSWRDNLSASKTGKITPQYVKQLISEANSIKIDKQELIDSIIKYDTLLEVANHFSTCRNTMTNKIKSILGFRGFSDAKTNLSK